MSVVAARTGSIVEVTRFTKTSPTVKASAQIWDWRTGDCLSEFQTVFDGMNRHAMSPDGRLYVAAGWRKGINGGIAGYDTQTGQKLWHRTDLCQVQSIRFSPDGERVWCIVEARPAHCLDAKDGSLLLRQRNVNEVIESPYSGHVLHCRPRVDYLLLGENTKTIPRLTAAMSDAAFSEDSLLLAEYSGPVRCIDIEAGIELWRYVPPPGYQVIQVSYQSDKSFYGFLFGYNGNADAALLRFSYYRKCVEICRHRVAWLSGGFGEGVYITKFGNVISLATGQILKSLSYPEKEDGLPRPQERVGL